MFNIYNVTKPPTTSLSRILSHPRLQPLEELLTNRDDEDYNPHEHREVPNPTSYAETMTHMLKATFGAGLLAMPNAFSRLGLVFGLLGIVFLGAFAVYCIQILVIGQYVLCKRQKVGYLSYPKSMKLALEGGPPCMRWSANLFAMAVDFFLILWQIGVCAIFLVFTAENLKQVIQYCGYEMSVRILICCCYPILVLLCLTKDLKLMAPLSTFSNVCNLIGILLVFYYLLHDDVEVDEHHLKLKSLHDIPVFIGTVLYALEAVGVILALEYNMENPKEFTGLFGLLSTAMVVIVVIYSILGICGYLKYGMDSKASITLNLPQNDKKAQAAKTAFAATIFTSFPLQNFVAWQIIWGLIQNKFTDNNKRSADITLRVVCASIPFVLAVAAPTLGPFIGLLGSLCLSTAAILFPAVLDISVYYPDQYGFCSYKLFTDIFIILFGIFCCFSGVYASLLEMIESLE